MHFLAVQLLLASSGPASALVLRSTSAPAGAVAGASGSSLFPPGLVPTGFDKQIRPMPEQGFNEHSGQDWVQHADYGSVVADWRRERPRQEGEVQEGDSTTRVCEGHPEGLWCNLWLKDQARRALGPRIVHQIKEVTSQNSGGKERVSDRVERRRRQENVETAKSKELRVARSKRRKAEAETLSGWERGVQKTREQAEDTQDELTAALPTGITEREKDVDRERKEKGKSFPPGMVSESGGPSPYEPVSFGASLIPAIANSVADLW